MVNWMSLFGPIVRWDITGDCRVGESYYSNSYKATESREGARR